MNIRTLAISGLLGAALALGGNARAAADYPSHPVKIVVSLPPGSGADTTARFLSKHLADKFGQPFIVENRPGANSFIAAQAVAGAAPDGYTMFVASNSPMTTNVDPSWSTKSGSGLYTNSRFARRTAITRSRVSFRIGASFNAWPA